MADLDPHRRPPPSLQMIFKRYQKLPARHVDEDTEIIDFARNSGLEHVKELRTIRKCSASSFGLQDAHPTQDGQVSFKVFECKKLPSLQIIPGLVSEVEQAELASRLLHRGLADAQHLTNVHKHYHVLYSLCESSRDSSANGPSMSSFFNMPNDSRERFLPLDANVHRPLTASQFLDRKLRWITLGGQYDWTEKVYPVLEPPEFPRDIAAYVQNAFPQMKPEAAIVNVYSPGDRLSLHRDVSEQSAADLVSISLGCDALFVAGLEGGTDESRNDDCSSVVVRVRSGDAVIMSGQARYAWHGVPQVISKTCPESLAAWPARDLESDGHDHFEAWRGWMTGKRINLNVRQMNDRLNAVSLSYASH